MVGPRPAASADDAIATATVTPPDLVLMDIKLQGAVDGIDAAGQLRESLRRPDRVYPSRRTRTTLRSPAPKKRSPSATCASPSLERELPHQDRSRAPQARDRKGDGAARAMVLDRAPEHRRRRYRQRPGRARDVHEPGRRVADDVEGGGRPRQAPLGGCSRSPAGARHRPRALLVGAKEARFSVIPPADTSLVTRSGESIVVVDTATPVMNDQGDVLGGLRRLPRRHRATQPRGARGSPRPSASPPSARWPPTWRTRSITP